MLPVYSFSPWILHISLSTGFFKAVNRRAGDTLIIIFKAEYFLKRLCLPQLLSAFLYFPFLPEPTAAWLPESMNVVPPMVDSCGDFSALVLFGFSASAGLTALDFQAPYPCDDPLMRFLPWPRFSPAPDRLAFPGAGFVHLGHSQFVLISLCTPSPMNSARPFV